MSSRYVSTLNFVDLIDALYIIIHKNDHKINHLMLNQENPDFEGFWSIIEQDVYANRQLNYRGVKVLFYKMMVFLLEDIQEGTFDYSDYDDQPCNENPERFDDLFDTELENDFDDVFKEKIEREFEPELNNERTQNSIKETISQIKQTHS
ncbi:hypothetical protein L1D51_21395 [Pseudoalteromonas shioyasakiensis]|uniref:hypothetical protein n=1 Tax=Pseudoalteromonas shioyasakiensis TaxID=1190813 RepID=UPI001EFC7FF1|nr:hypothetical protein [Pseudoalteromonas shioyasakiensis]MCG9736508.1 hypothetical protein [Pseudoalteromonas shioyasakiensis]